MKKILFLTVVILFGLKTNSQVIINEVFATNASVNLNKRYYNYSGWAELYNKGTIDTELSDYYFSDDKNNKTKWKLPPYNLVSKQFIAFGFNEENIGYYTNFKLEAKGAKLYLFNSNGSIIDSLTYPKQYPNISYTRVPDGSSTWQYNMEPTFQASNSAKAYPTFTSKPEFSVRGGFFSLAFNLSITTINAGAEIRYTINGSEPKANSLKYITPILISKTTIIRAQVFEPDSLPSEIVTQSYIFPDHKINLPAYSLTTDSVNLWDNTMGIYVTGSNGLIGYCSNTPRNYNQDWERPFNLEFYDTLGVQQLNQYTGIKIGGNCSRGFAQKTFAIYPRNLYGKGKLKFPFFKDKNIAEFDRLFLRNAGNDWGNAFLRDALFHALVKNQMDIDFAAYQPSVIFLNGNYWGMLDTREKIDERYIMSNYNLEDTQFDMLENNKVVINGSAENYTNFMNFVSTSDLTNSVNYENVKSKMDMNEYINYMVTQIYIGNTDWPGNNLKYWRSKLGGGKWRWILYDLDFGYGVYDKNINHNTLQFALQLNGPTWPNPPWSTLLFRKLIENKDFKAEFVQRFATYLNTVFQTNKVIHTIDSLQNNIKYEMYYHNKKWNGINDWTTNVNFLRSFAQQRPEYVRQHIITTLGLSGTYSLTIKSNIDNAGSLIIDNIPVNGDFNGTYFKDYAVDIRPVAKHGYKFIGWFKQSGGLDSVNFINKGDTWKYSDNGAIPSLSWQSPAYNDDSWKSGKAQLGYGDGDEITNINQGNDPNNKYITTYFRKTINITDLKTYSGLKLRILVDDGAMIYLNGTEIARHRMPSGTISYASFANVSTNELDEQRFYEYSVPTSNLVEGLNKIAVEVHQFNASSSDVSFDLELKCAKLQNQKEEPIFGQDIDFVSQSNAQLVAKYQYFGNLPVIYFNEMVADNQNGIKDEKGDLTPWIELYNASNQSVNLAGLFISNNKKNLTLWQIPADDLSKTTINPNGFLVLWADGQTNEGIQHLPFELNKTGGQLYVTNITGTDTTILDSISYQAQLTNIPYGRYKDGTIDNYYLSLATPLSFNAAPNKLPEFTSSPVTAANDQSPYSYSITASDLENDKLSFGSLKLPSWLNLTDNNDGTAKLSGTPKQENKGKNPVSITVSDGKSIFHTEQVFNIQVEGSLYINDQSVTNWKIYPNPVKDFVQIIPDKEVKNYQLSIRDISGKLMFEKTNISGNYKLNLSNYATGVYFLITQINQDSFITKLIRSE